MQSFALTFNEARESVSARKEIEGFPHTHTHTHTHTRTHTHTHACTCAHMYMHACTHTHTQGEGERERERETLESCFPWESPFVNGYTEMYYKRNKSLILILCHVINCNLQ